MHRPDGRRSYLQRNSAFQKPESRNAATTLTWMAAVITIAYSGTSFCAYKLNAHPLPGQTLVSASHGAPSGRGSFITVFSPPRPPFLF